MSCSFYNHRERVFGFVSLSPPRKHHGKKHSKDKKTKKKPEKVVKILEPATSKFKYGAIYFHKGKQVKARELYKLTQVTMATFGNNRGDKVEARGVIIEMRPRPLMAVKLVSNTETHEKVSMKEAAVITGVSKEEVRYCASKGYTLRKKWLVTFNGELTGDE